MEVGIVGAGVAGAAAAFALGGHEVIVFETEPNVGGRAATRERDGCTYDYGANYVKSEDSRVTDLLTGTLGADELVDVAEPVWTFDAAGEVSEGRDADDHKWTSVDGISQVAERLIARTGATVHHETHVGSLAREGERWRAFEDDGTDLGAFDAVLLTPPAPRTADLLRATDWADPLRVDLVDALEAVPFRAVSSTVLHYGFAFEPPWYALVDTDRAHDIGWLSREECKEGHVPDGESLLVVQMAPDWSRHRADDDPEAVCADAAGLVANLLGDDRFADPDWTDHRAWRYALPDAAVDPRVVRAAETHDLYVAGDWIAGEGRVHLALRSGLEAGERIAGE